MIQRRILQDWTRVDDFQVDGGEFRSYEYHVVADDENDRVTLTIRVYREKEKSFRLDPSDFDGSSDHPSYAAFAERRVKHLYSCGLI
jgi:hypothetical protein